MKVSFIKDDIDPMITFSKAIKQGTQKSPLKGAFYGLLR